MKKSISIIIILLLTTALLFAIYTIYNNKKDNNETQSQTKDEQELLDQTIINQLIENTSAISISSQGTPDIKGLYEQTLTDITEQDKLHITLMYSPKISSMPEIQQVSKKDFEESYYKLFGKTTINHKDISDGCPFATYDSSNEMYNLSYACGGGSPYTYLTYNYKFTNKDNKYYVYQSLGIINGETNKIQKDVNGTIYQDYKEGFELNQDNYQDFSAYKWTYEKQDNYYVFKSVERIK